jgi:hypothetical protein
LIHCRHDVGEVPGYKEVGVDKQGFFMWAIDDGSDRSEELEPKRRQREGSATGIVIAVLDGLAVKRYIFTTLVCQIG